jgi:hypothetical protein
VTTYRNQRSLTQRQFIVVLYREVKELTAIDAQSSEEEIIKVANTLELSAVAQAVVPVDRAGGSLITGISAM